jgi:hypothetical protein
LIVADTSGITEHMEIIGADGAHVGTVDRVEGDRIKLRKADSGEGRHEGHHHFVSTGLVADVEGNKVRLSATGANALLFEEEAKGSDRSEPYVVSAPGQSRGVDRVRAAVSGWNWNKIGLGAAAVGAVGAAALLARGKTQEDDDFELRLETDENVRLISSTKVEGTTVVGVNGERLGTIESFMVDKYTGRVAYAVMAFGGTMGLGTSLFPLPWPLLEYDVDKDGYSLNVTKEQLASAPKFEPKAEPEFDAAYRKRVLLFYRAQ